MRNATTAPSTEKTDGPPAEAPHERVTRKVLQNWGWLDQHDVEGVLGILDELRLRRSVSPAMAQAEAQYQQHFEVVSAALGDPRGEYGRDALSDLDGAHGECMNLYEERGFRLGLAVAAALRDTEELAEAPADETGERDGDESDAGPEPELSDAARRANRLRYAAEGLRQARQQAILLPDHRLEMFVTEAVMRLDKIAAGEGDVETPSTPPATPVGADLPQPEGSAERRRVQHAARISQELQEALSDLSRDIAEVSLDLDETMTLVLTRGVGQAALRARELGVYATN